MLRQRACSAVLLSLIFQLFEFTSSSKTLCEHPNYLIETKFTTGISTTTTGSHKHEEAPLLYHYQRLELPDAVDCVERCIETSGQTCKAVLWVTPDRPVHPPGWRTSPRGHCQFYTTNSEEMGDLPLEEGSDGIGRGSEKVETIRSPAPADGNRYTLYEIVDTCDSQPRGGRLSGMLGRLSGAAIKKLELLPTTGSAFGSEAESSSSSSRSNSKATSLHLHNTKSRRPIPARDAFQFDEPSSSYAFSKLGGAHGGGGGINDGLEMVPIKPVVVSRGGFQEQRMPGSEPYQSLCPGRPGTNDPCAPKESPSSAVWSAWNSDGACSVTCGTGVRQMHRYCNAPPGQGGTDGKVDCPGEAVRMEPCQMPACDTSYGVNRQPCDTRPCPAVPVWGEWREWNECSKSCGGGERTRQRECIIPAGSSGDCGGSGSAEEQCSCNTQPCPSWARWSDWTPCSATCGNEGARLRTRECHYEGRLSNECVGSGQDQAACQLPPCPHWASWSAWSACSASCGHGQQLRSRECAPSGFGCTGGDREIRFCQLAVCPYYSQWTEWGQCSVTCGRGTCERTRRCITNDPLPGAVLPSEEEVNSRLGIHTSETTSSGGGGGGGTTASTGGDGSTGGGGTLEAFEPTKVPAASSESADEVLISTPPISTSSSSASKEADKARLIEMAKNLDAAQRGGSSSSSTTPAPGTTTTTIKLYEHYLGVTQSSSTRLQDIRRAPLRTSTTSLLLRDSSSSSVAGMMNVPIPVQQHDGATACYGPDRERRECDAGPCCEWGPWAAWGTCMSAATAGCFTGNIGCAGASYCAGSSNPHPQPSATSPTMGERRRSRVCLVQPGSSSLSVYSSAPVAGGGSFSNDPKSSSYPHHRDYAPKQLLSLQFAPRPVFSALPPPPPPSLYPNQPFASPFLPAAQNPAPLFIGHAYQASPFGEMKSQVASDQLREQCCVGQSSEVEQCQVQPPTNGCGPGSSSSPTTAEQSSSSSASTSTSNSASSSAATQKPQYEQDSGIHNSSAAAAAMKSMPKTVSVSPTTNTANNSSSSSTAAARSHASTKEVEEDGEKRGTAAGNEECYWAPWSEWRRCVGECNKGDGGVTAGEGTRSRDRVCLRNTYDCRCVGEDEQKEKCTPKHCLQLEQQDDASSTALGNYVEETRDPIRSCYWSEWSSWSAECDKEDGSNYRQRTRLCVGLRALIHDCECVGASFEQMACRGLHQSYNSSSILTPAAANTSSRNSAAVTIMSGGRTRSTSGTLHHQATNSHTPENSTVTPFIRFSTQALLTFPQHRKTLARSSATATTPADESQPHYHRRKAAGNNDDESSAACAWSQWAEWSDCKPLGPRDCADRALGVANAIVEGERERRRQCECGLRTHLSSCGGGIAAEKRSCAHVCKGAT